MTLLGGMGTFAGPVLGAFTIIGLQNLLADRVGSWVTVIIGVIFVVCVVAFRRGFVGELLRLAEAPQATLTGAARQPQRGLDGADHSGVVDMTAKRLTKEDIRNHDRHPESDRPRRARLQGRCRDRRGASRRCAPPAAPRKTSSSTGPRKRRRGCASGCDRQRGGRLRLRDHPDAPLLWRSPSRAPAG